MRRPSRQGLPPVRPHRLTQPAKSQDVRKEKHFLATFTLCFQTFLLAFITYVSEAQDLNSDAETFFSAVRQGDYPPTPKVLSSGEGGEILDVLRPFLRDSSEAVKEKVCELTYLASSGSRDSLLRGRGIDMLIASLNNQYTQATASALNFLSGFTKNDFTLAAKDSLRKRIRGGAVFMDQLVKLAGFLDLADLIPDIRVRAQPGNSGALRWAALLSLARLGDRAAMAEIMMRVRKLPLNDDLVYEVFPSLIYTRRRELITLAVEALHRDEKKCLSADVEKETPIPCGYRIMEQLAPVIDGYPLQIDDNGDIKTDNYEAALQTVRNWFETEKDYIILTDKY